MKKNYFLNFIKGMILFLLPLIIFWTCYLILFEVFTMLNPIILLLASAATAIFVDVKLFQTWFGKKNA